MNGREMHEAIYAGEQFDRLPIRGIEGWRETHERWEREGMPTGENPLKALDLMSDDVTYLRLNLNMYPMFDLEILEKGEEYVTVIDEFRVTRKLLRSDFDRSGGRMDASGAMSSMSQWIGFPVTNMESWKELFEARFRATPEGRIPEDITTDGDTMKKRAETRWVAH